MRVGGQLRGRRVYSSRRVRAFVVSEKNGSWGKAMQVPGAAALSGAGGNSEVDALSCASAGNCAAGGSYSSDGDQQAFVVSEKNGSWGRAIEVPGLAALNNGTYAGIDSVSCASVGNCAVAGHYDNGAPEAFVVSENERLVGHGDRGARVGGLRTATFASVSCASAGNCAAAGTPVDPITDASSGPLVVSEKNGTWGNANSGSWNDGQRAKRRRIGVVRVGGQLRGRRRATRPASTTPTRRSWSGRRTARGAPRSRCPAWRR